MCRSCYAESVGRQEVIVEAKAPDNGAGQGFRAALHGRKSDDGDHHEQRHRRIPGCNPSNWHEAPSLLITKRDGAAPVCANIGEER